MKPDEIEGWTEWKQRKCMAKRCTRPVAVVSPGQAEIRLTGPSIDLPLIPAQPEINLCLYHAQLIGWPWPSETTKRRKMACS